MMRHMILGVLRHHGARHGYALMKEIRARTGVQVSIGNVYRELARLAREGLARSTPNPPEADPRRAPYEITAAGIAAFGAWLSTTPTKMQAPFHDEFSARLLPGTGGARGGQEDHRAVEGGARPAGQDARAGTGRGRHTRPCA